MALSRCSSCHRHVLAESRDCPFCGGHSLLRGAVLLAGALALGGCDKEAAPGDSGATTKSSTPDTPTPQDPDTPEAKPDVGGGEESAREPVRAVYAGPPPGPEDKPEAPKPEKTEGDKPEADGTKDDKAAPEPPKPE